jgi:transcriptional regulator with XRE-family HTH domain
VKNTLAQQFGSCVRTLRLATGMSQVVFGEKCGFYQTYLSRIENGQANPTLNTIEVIANALDISVFDLFDYIKAAQQPSPPKHPSKVVARPQL